MLCYFFFSTLFNYVSAHGYLSQPTALYKDLSTMTNYITTVDSQSLYPEYKWDGSPESNSQQYQKLVLTKKIRNLKDFVDQYVQGCPANILDNVVDVRELKYLHWQNDQYREGFIASHKGPCEAWIDNQKVFNDSDCAAHYTSYPAEIPIDYKICKSKECLFTFYWKALHEPQWQLYKGCVKVRGDESMNTPDVTFGEKPISLIVGNKSFNCINID